MPRPRPPDGGGAPARGRVGPRPLALHLRLALLDAVAGAADLDEARTRLGRSLEGLRAYWSCPRPSPSRSPGRVLWRSGSCWLRDLGGPSDGLPVLAVPSLVNRARVLHLGRGRSLLGHLARAGLRPLLLDWGEPRGPELGHGLGDYVGRLAGGALDAALAQGGGRPPALLGYCMGGLLATALAAARPRDVAGVALLATPWDFHAVGGWEEDGGRRMLRLLAAGFGPASAAVAGLGYAPVEVVQSLFALMAPAELAAKFRGLAGARVGDRRLGEFAAVEDWLNDGVPLAGPAALEILWHWYGANLPARGLWAPGGRGAPVRPGELDLPFLVAVPARDRIVPPASARAIVPLLKDVTVVEPEAGHIGMVVGRRAPEALYRPLASWLRRLASGVGRASDACDAATAPI